MHVLSVIAVHNNIFIRYGNFQRMNWTVYLSDEKRAGSNEKPGTGNNRSKVMKNTTKMQKFKILLPFLVCRIRNKNETQSVVKNPDMKNQEGDAWRIIESKRAIHNVSWY